MPHASPDPDARSLRALWLAVTAGAALVLVVVGALVLGQPARGTGWPFYLNALLNIGAIAGAFAVQRRLDERLPGAASRTEAATLVRDHAMFSLGLMDASVLAAAAIAYLTGDAMNLAFAAPFFAFAWLFWPSDARYAGWMARAGVRD